MAKKLNQQDLLKLTSIGTPPTDSVAFAAKSDGLYQKIGTVESKLSTTAELLDRVEIPVPANAKFTDTVYSHPSTHPYSMLTGVPATFAPSAHSHDATEITDTLTKVMMTVAERNKLGTLSNYTLTKEKIEALLKGDITTHTHSQYLTSYTDTKYTAGKGLTLSGTQFSLPVTISGTGTYVKSVTHNTNENGITVTLGTPPNTNTTYGLMPSTELTTGTATTSRVVSAKLLSDWINSKGYITSYINTTYTAGTNVQISAANVISATDTKYTLPVATATVRGGVELFSNTVQSVAANAVTTTASRTYGIQLNSAGQAVVNVPWTNTNTTYSTGTLVQLKAGTDTTGRLQTAKLLNEWIDSKGYITSYIDTTYNVATTSVDGLMSSGDKTKLNNIASNANNYSLPTATASVLGGVKIGSRLTITSGVLSANVQSTNDFTNDYKTKLDGIASKANNYSHPSTHPATMITGLHASATTGVAGSVAWGNVTGKPETFAPSTHTHSNISITAGTGLSGGGALSTTRTLSIASTYAPNTSTSLGASKNLNDYRTAGFYHQTSNTNATTALNYPVASAGALLVETAAGVIQTYKVYNSSDVYVRGYYGTTWTAWRKLVNASDSIPWANVSSKPSTATRWPAWGEVTGKPTTFNPSTHSHTKSQITDFPTTWAWTNVSSKPSTATRWPAWGEVTGKPSTFAPSAHTHTTANITDLGNIATINKNNSTANYLRGDGTWVTPPNTTYIVATTDTNGLMSSGDKTKLDGIAEGANKTTLSSSVTSTSTATAATSSAVRSAYNRGSTGVTDAATAQARADSAYTLASGKENSFTKNDAFNKKFGTAKGTVAQGNDSRINNGQTAYGWGNHASAGYIKSYVDTTYTAGTNIQISEDNVISATDTKYIVATTDVNGLMSSGDKTKLNGIATGANKYSHPTTPGNKHIPSGGATNQILRYSESGTAVWSAEKNTTYTALAGGGLTLSTGNAFSVKYGTTAGTACQGNDSRLSNARPPTVHTHAWSEITSRPTKLSEFTFDLTSWSGNLTITGTLTANALFKDSDVRLKELIQPINASNIDNIDLIEFNWKDSGKKDYGVKAQDVEAYYPELVNTDDTGIKSVNYESLYAIKIARLEERIKELEDKLCQKN